MELRVLQYFVEIARNKSMTKASMRIHITQPTLSKQIKELEEELGQKLFKRGNYNVTLTKAGELLYKRAVDILELVDLTREEFTQLNEYNGGSIYLGCAESEGISILAKVAKKIQEKYPSFKLNIYSGNLETVSEKIDKGLLDFAVVVQNVDYSKYSYLDLPNKDIWGLIVTKDSLLAKKDSVMLEELMDLPLIVSRQGATNEMPSWLHKNYHRLNIVATYDLIYNASILVKEGFGYALGFDKLVNTSPESDLRFIPIKPEIYSPMRLIWRSEEKLSETAKIFLDELKNILD